MSVVKAAQLCKHLAQTNRPAGHVLRTACPFWSNSSERGISNLQIFVFFSFSSSPYFSLSYLHSRAVRMNTSKFQTVSQPVGKNCLLKINKDRVHSASPLEWLVSARSWRDVIVLSPTMFLPTDSKVLIEWMRTGKARIQDQGHAGLGTERNRSKSYPHYFHQMAYWNCPQTIMSRRFKYCIALTKKKNCRCSKKYSMPTEWHIARVL